MKASQFSQVKGAAAGCAKRGVGKDPTQICPLERMGELDRYLRGPEFSIHPFLSAQKVNSQQFYMFETYQI